MPLLNENEYALIDDFLAGRLSAAEAVTVEQRIASDAGFAEEVKWMKQLGALKHQKKAFEVLDMFDAVRRERRRRRRLLLVLLLVLAFIALMLMLIVAADRREQKPLNQEIPTHTDTPGLLLEKPQMDPPPIPEERPESKKAPAPESSPIAENKVPDFNVGDFVTYKPGLQTLGDESAAAEARLLLDQGERLKALPVLEQYLAGLSAEEEDFDLRLETGKIYLKELKEYQKAAFHFRKVAEGDVIARYRREASFYLAVTYLAEGKKAEAQPLLKSVAGSNTEPWNTLSARLLQEQ